MKPKQMPVAWRFKVGIDNKMYQRDKWHLRPHNVTGPDVEVQPLYTAPPQRKWQGLTDEEILEEYRQSYGDEGNLTDIYFAHAIEAKLREKNT